jgi:hypothetical protein
VPSSSGRVTTPRSKYCDKQCSSYLPVEIDRYGFETHGHLHHKLIKTPRGAFEVKFRHHYRTINYRRSVKDLLLECGIKPIPKNVTPFFQKGYKLDLIARIYIIYDYLTDNQFRVFRRLVRLLLKQYFLDKQRKYNGFNDRYDLIHYRKTRRFSRLERATKRVYKAFINSIPDIRFRELVCDLQAIRFCKPLSI